MTEMRIAVMGAAGRMGRELVRAVHETGCVVAGGTERSGARSSAWTWVRSPGSGRSA